jgi:pimeloyl-ACP methyl ester carboxylesterase
MPDVLYLHGFGTTKPEDEPISLALRRSLADNQIHSPGYHPAGVVKATRVGLTLSALERFIQGSAACRMHLVGYSFGGLLAAMLAERRPDLVANLLLLAPAIDNVARNYQGRDPSIWRMPPEYVDELKTYPARPRIVRPTVLVHGRLDTDAGGSAPWRIEEWVREQPFRAAHLLAGVDHSMEPWLSGGSADGPAFRDLVADLVAD